MAHACFCNMPNIEGELRPLKKSRRGMMDESLEGILMRGHEEGCGLAFEMILESSVLYKRGVATRQKDLLTSAQACQSLLSDNWANTGGRTSKGKSWKGDLKAFRGDRGMRSKYPHGCL